MEENNPQNEENNQEENNQQITSNLSIIPLGQKTISYYNSSKDNYHSKQYKKALINILIYIKLVPNNPKAYLLKGKIYMNLNEFEKSLNSFLKSHKLGETGIEILYGIARAYKELYKFDEALKYYNKALEMDPSAKSYYLYAKCLYSMGKKEYAIEIYNKAIQINPNYLEAYFNKGVCLSNLNFKEEAINMYNKTIELNPNFVDAYFQRGYCYYNLKQYQKAMIEMNKVLQLDPNYYQAYYEKGFCFQKMKRYEEAIIEISKSIQQNMYFEKAYFQRGYCLELIKDYNSAIKDYKKVIELNKNSYMGYFRLGLCYLYKKDLNDALNMFNESIKLNRANYDAYYYKGMCQRYLKYHEDAIITFNFFLNCFINNKSLSSREISEEQIANVYYNKGICLLSLERFSEAIKMFTNYLKKNKTSYEVYFKRAICYYNIKNYKKAVYDLSFVIQELNENKKGNRENDKKKKISKENDVDDEDEEDEHRGKMCKKNIEDETEEILPEIYFLRCKSYINLDKIDNGLKDINTFFQLVEAEKNKIKEELSQSKNRINKNIKDSDINRIIFKKYDIIDAHIKRGYCHLVLLDYVSAIQDFEEAIKLDPTYTTAYFNMGICLYNLNKKKEAIYYYQKVLNFYYLDIEAFLNLVKCYREIGKPNKSYDLLIKKMPSFLKEENNFSIKIPKLFYETAMSLLLMEKFDESIIYFKKSIDFEKNKNQSHDTDLISECYYKQGFALSKLNNKKEAVQNFDEALKYNKKNPDIYNYKAHCLMILENYEGAIDSYNKSIELNKKKYTINNDGNFSIGYCYYKMKKYEEAIKYFDISRNINENEIKNIYLSGLEDCDTGKGEDSLIKFYSKYKELSAKFIELNYYNGLCNIEMKNYENALKNFDKCLKYDKKFSEGYFKKGIVLSLLNKPKEAIEEFENAIFYNNTIDEYKEALEKEKAKIENEQNININKLKNKLTSISRNNNDKSEERKECHSNEEKKEYYSDTENNDDIFLKSKNQFSNERKKYSKRNVLKNTKDFNSCNTEQK